MGSSLTSSQVGGLGIRKTTHVASSAFLASAARVVDLVSAILPAGRRVSTICVKDIALSAWNQLCRGTAPADQAARAQKCWDTQIVKSLAGSLMRAATDYYTRARLLATSAPHTG